jgi:hypothetical protein
MQSSPWSHFKMLLASLFSSGRERQWEYNRTISVEKQ